jgi:hypothetical protein
MRITSTVPPKPAASGLRTEAKEKPRGGVAIEDQVFDLPALEQTTTRLPGTHIALPGWRAA